MKDDFSVDLIDFFLKIALLLKRRFDFGHFGLGLVFYVVFVDFFLVSEAFVSLFNLVEQSVAVVALFGVKYKLFNWFSFQDLVYILCLSGAYFAVAQVELAFEDTHELEWIWTVFEGLIKLTLEVGLVVFQAVIEEHLDGPELWISVLVSLEEIFLSLEDLFLQGDLRVSFDDIFQNGSYFACLTVD